MILTAAAAADPASGLQVRDFIAAGALVLSIILAIREFLKRPKLTSWMQVKRSWDGTKWEHEGLVINVGNTGAASMIIESVGQVSKTGTSAPGGSFVIEGVVHRNPDIPFALPPGEMVTFRFPPSGFPVDDKYRAVEIRRKWKFPFVPRDNRRINHIVRPAGVVPIEKAKPPHSIGL